MMLMIMMIMVILQYKQYEHSAVQYKHATEHQENERREAAKVLKHFLVELSCGNK